MILRKSLTASRIRARRSGFPYDVRALALKLDALDELRCGELFFFKRERGKIEPGRRGVRRVRKQPLALYVQRTDPPGDVRRCVFAALRERVHKARDLLLDIQHRFRPRAVLRQRPSRFK